MADVKDKLLDVAYRVLEEEGASALTTRRVCKDAGVTMPTMVLQTATIILNAILAPVLIAGWGTGIALGVAGAGWASTISGFIGTIALVVMFPRVQSYLRLRLDRLKPKFSAWQRLVFIGLPTSIEFLMMFVLFIVIVKVMGALQKMDSPAAPTTKQCPECLETVPLKARRCRACASALAA